MATTKVPAANKARRLMKPISQNHNLNKFKLGRTGSLSHWLIWLIVIKQANTQTL